MLKCQKDHFNLPDDLVYLNCAYMSPLMKSIEIAGKLGIEGKRNPFKVTVDKFFEPANAVRKEFAKLINCSESEQIVIIPSVSYGMANAARNLSLPKNSKVILAGEQFPSNTYPWFRIAAEQGADVKVIHPDNSNSNRAQKWNEDLVKAIDIDTAVVAISQCHWADGTLFDLKALRVKTREVGAALIIDGTQSVGAFPFDIQEIEPDALICAGYKWLMGPYSIGLAYYSPMFNDGIPVEESWLNRVNSQDFAGLVIYEDRYLPGALRYEVGEHSNFIMVPMLLEALRQINSWGVDEIQSYCKRISKSSIERLKDAGFWIENEAFRGNHLFGIRLPSGMDINAVKAEFEKRNIFVSIRGSSIRVSPYVYNTTSDVEMLTEALTSQALQLKV